MLTQEQIQYVREWAKSGNEPLPPNEVSAIIPLCIVVFPTRDYSVILNSAGLTIAALAEALEQAATTADLMFGATEPGRVSQDDRAELAETIRNQKALLG